MEKQIYITDDEREKCRKVADAYAELEYADIIVLNAGKYGFVKLLYYHFPNGFDDAITYTDSRKMFDDLWDDWLNSQLYEIGVNASIIEFDYEEIFEMLPKEQQKALLEKRFYFAEKAGITDILVDEKNE